MPRGHAGGRNRRRALDRRRLGKCNRAQKSARLAGRASRRHGTVEAGRSQNNTVIPMSCGLSEEGCCVLARVGRAVGHNSVLTILRSIATAIERNPETHRPALRRSRLHVNSCFHEVFRSLTALADAPGAVKAASAFRAPSETPNSLPSPFGITWGPHPSGCIARASRETPLDAGSYQTLTSAGSEKKMPLPDQSMPGAHARSSNHAEFAIA